MTLLDAISQHKEKFNKELNPKIREWTCPSCNASHQRDVNAAINIKRVGTSTLSGETIRATKVA